MKRHPHYKYKGTLPQTSTLQRKDKTYGEPVYFNGYLASLQQELASVDIDIVLKSVYYMDMYNDIVGKSADEYKAYVLERLHPFEKKLRNPHTAMRAKSY